MIRHEMYATKEGASYSHIYYHESLVKMCVQAHILVVPITVTEHEEGNYWGWYEYEEDGKPARITHIYPSEHLTKICSPDYFQQDIKDGKGRLIRLRIEERIKNGVTG